jgi:hypothetical protein
VQTPNPRPRRCQRLSLQTTTPTTQMSTPYRADTMLDHANTNAWLCRHWPLSIWYGRPATSNVGLDDPNASERVVRTLQRQNNNNWHSGMLHVRASVNIVSRKCIARVCHITTPIFVYVKCIRMCALTNRNGYILN